MPGHRNACFAAGCAAALLSPPGYADTFAPFFVCPGDEVLVSGSARDGARVVAWFEQPAAGAPPAQVGSAVAAASGQYVLRVRVPPTASPGAADVTLRCQGCGDASWSIRGLRVLSRCTGRAAVARAPG